MLKISEVQFLDVPYHISLFLKALYLLVSSNIGQETDMARLKTILDDRTEVYRWNGRILENHSIYLTLYNSKLI
jgi:hypothetical protein